MPLSSWRPWRGLPVAARCRRHREMRDPQNRPFVVRCDDAALAGAWMRCRGCRARQRLGAANSRRAEARFAEADMVAAWEGLFRALSTR